MKKRMIAIVLLLGVCLSMLTGCDDEQQGVLKVENGYETVGDGDKPYNGEAEDDPASVSYPQNGSRYVLYVSGGKLYGLDTTNGKVKSISLGDRDAVKISAVRVADDGPQMMFEIMVEEEVSNIYYWDGQSERAALIDEDATLVKVSQDLRICTYVKGLNQDTSNSNINLFRFTLGEGTERLSESSVGMVSMSDDGSSIFYCEYPYRYSGDYRKESDGKLYCIADGTKTEIAEIYGSFVDTDAERTVIGYLKRDANPGGMYVSWPAYMWTPEDGEKALPFRANQLCVFGENEIYYSTVNGETYDHYFYDGEKSYLLAEDGDHCGHKLGRFYCFHAKDKDSGNSYAKNYLAHHETAVRVTERRQCTIMGTWASVSSVDEKKVYCWTRGEDSAERVVVASLTENGQITVAEKFESNEYSHTVCCYNDVVLHTCGEDLYLNDQKLLSGAESWDLSADGKTVYYWKDGAVYQYSAAGEDQKLWEGEKTDYAVLLDGNLLILDISGQLLQVNASAVVTVAENVASIKVAAAWSETGFGNSIQNNILQGVCANGYIMGYK